MSQKSFRTRKAAAEHVKDLLVKDSSRRTDVPRQLFIVVDHTPGRARPTYRVTELTPDYGDRWYGPFRQTNVEELTRRLGVVWPVSAAWLGGVIR